MDELIKFNQSTIIFENFSYEFDAYFGIIKCEILPPNHLRFPVLPSRINSNLFFLLQDQYVPK
jgi:hypothetical protein